MEYGNCNGDVTVVVAARSLAPLWDRISRMLCRSSADNASLSKWPPTRLAPVSSCSSSTVERMPS